MFTRDFARQVLSSFATFLDEIFSLPPSSIAAPELGSGRTVFLFFSEFFAS